ncbi:vascular-related unknown protein 1 [Cajanus cajan]|uniref:vascular-related unknown protein 1 n=1 Tax=Cajanus cajan TaxID=3821 RepID=UPI00098DD50D|nr:vascular-related unknown protein 1 [Cajanus cajan]XP_029130993.1 vascular-related unknown protein 1 [Cajanus cajan]
MSSITKAPPSSNDTEESGWTTYFDDFFNNHVDNKCSMSLSGVACNSSLNVSDAASLVEKKVSHIKQVDDEFCVKKNVKRSSFKKSITTLIDDALEDTATSPLNTAKVLYANQKIDKANRQK